MRIKIEVGVRPSPLEFYYVFHKISAKRFSTIHMIHQKFIHSHKKILGIFSDVYYWEHNLSHPKRSFLKSLKVMIKQPSSILQQISLLVINLCEQKLAIWIKMSNLIKVTGFSHLGHNSVTTLI